MSATTASPPATQERVQSEQSKFVQHLATYPALTALAGLIASFPLVKIFASNAIPLLQAIHERSKPVTDPVAETATPYLRTLDQVGDAALNRIDRQFPGLQKVQPHEVYEGAQNYIDSIKGNAKSVYESRVAQPIHHATDVARTQYSSIYNSNVRKGISPLNDQLESALDYYLPGEEDIQSSEHAGGSELKRTYSLARVAAERAAPKLVDVYTTKLEEQSHGNSNPSYIAKLLALLATGKFLSIESYNHVLNHFGSTQKLQAAVDEVKASASHYEKETEKIVSDASKNTSETARNALEAAKEKLPEAAKNDNVSEPSKKVSEASRKVSEASKKVPEAAKDKASRASQKE